MTSIETQPQPSPLTIRLFGDFVLQRDSLPCPPTRTRKEQWLLALLVLRSPQGADRSWLAGLLWPDSHESQAAENLRHSLSNLRKVLGTDAARLTSPNARSIAFDISGADIDVLNFDAALLKGDVAALERAIDAYRGPLLQGCDEAWLLPERYKRAEAYASALESLAQQYCAMGAAKRAISTLKKLIALDPLRTSAQHALMQALADAGDYIALTQVYRNFRLHLHEQLAMPPEEETVRLYESLRAGHNRVASRPQPLHTVVAASLPFTPTQLIGREADVVAVSDCLTRSRMVTLLGPGGTGKTRLAIAVGQHLRESFAEQIWFVALAELTDAARLAEFVRDRLGLSGDQADPLGQVIRKLSAVPSLLILDNYEHLVEGGAHFVETLLASIPALVCLITSRRALHLGAEAQYRVPSLAFPADVEPAPLLLQFPCVQLFVERAAAHRPGFHLTPENGSDVVALCAKLEGIPLAIELVASWADVLTPSQMRARLEAQFAFPTNGSASMPERHARLRLQAALYYYRQMGEVRQTGFAQQQLIYVACAEHDFGRAQTMAEALLRSGREKNRWHLITYAFEVLQHIAIRRQDYSQARAYGEQALAFYPAEETVFRSNMLVRLGWTAALQGEFLAAREYLSTSVRICQTGGCVAHEAWTYYTLANVAHHEGFSEEGREWILHALHLFEILGETGSMITCLGRLARLSEMYPEDAALFWCAYSRFLREAGPRFSAKERVEIATARTTMQALLSEERRMVIEAKSASMSLREVIQYAQRRPMRENERVTKCTPKLAKPSLP